MIHKRAFAYDEWLEEFDKEYPTREEAKKQNAYSPLDPKLTTKSYAANLVTSLATVCNPIDDSPVELSAPESNLHYPVIDLDLEASLVPSRTPGHHHLYLDKILTHAQYVKLLEVMHEVGLVEKGFLDGLKRRGYTCTRIDPYFKHMEASEEAIDKMFEETTTYDF